MTDASATVSVLIAATQSVAKVYVIGAVGFLAVKFPRGSPLLPSSAVSILARFCFNVLVIPLIFSTTALSVSPDTLSDYLFVLVSGFVVLAISYLLPTLLNWCIRIDNPHDFCALRIAATFPNVVALPILIFPSLCEYPVVFQGYAVQTTTTNDSGSAVSDEDLQQQCVALSNTLVFVYFFIWSLAFWSIGYPQLLLAAAKRNIENVSTSDSVDEGKEEHDPSASNSTMESSMSESPTSRSVIIDNGADTGSDTGEETDATSSTSPVPTNTTLLSRIGSNAVLQAFLRTCTSPGFLALAAGFCTGCIAPLKSALFESGGALRFLGSSLETLGQASSPISTMVVAASLVPALGVASSTTTVSVTLTSSAPTATAPEDEDARQEARADEETPVATSDTTGCNTRGSDVLLADSLDNPIMSDPNFGPYRRRLRRSSQIIQRTQSMVHRQSARLVEALPLRSSPEMRRRLIWFTLSRLILAPAVVIAIIVTLDCTSSVLSNVPALAKLVVIFNASVPGALIVVVLLKAQPHLADTAAAVAKVYLPTYMIAILTMAGWTALGMYVTLPTSKDIQTPMICPARW